MRALILGLMVLLIGCSSKPETPLEGDYSANIGEMRFDTTTSANLSLAGTAPFSGDIYEAAWKRKGDTLTLTTRPKFKRMYQITYTFDVIDDGAQLILRRIDTTTEATGKTETTKIDSKVTPDVSFSKHNR